MSNVVTEGASPHGLRCARCDTLIRVGEPYERVPNSMLADERATPVLLFVCPYCVTGGFPSARAVDPV
jgi:hypothetical protein